MLTAWPCPAAAGETISHTQEFALETGPGDGPRVLVIPALFEEANRTRRLLVSTMRMLAAEGVGCVLPDLPGCNESLSPLGKQTLSSWRNAVNAALSHFGAAHILAVRGGASLAPAGVIGWRLAPAPGSVLLRQMVRARMLADREGGNFRPEEDYHVEGRTHGITLGGYRLSAQMVSELEADGAPPLDALRDIAADALPGSPLWLRIEPGENAAQSRELAQMIASEILH
ncbi:hypothetical protein ACFO0A_10855 [Novosphingobium tardum]|uniref:Alpha/beta hydrolase n=1 Tax=Novosphingobium tardum TaxID=1538021 RepID=A0ABV8RQY0_9SPHN